MEKLTVDEEGKITIPAQILTPRGLRPGDELTLVEVAEGLLLYQHGANSPAARWWNSLSEGERRQAQIEANSYLSLSAAARDQIWDEGAESIKAEAEAEGDEIDFPVE
jgi:AbrB family looped-hinge helix DNA binding protein